MKKFELKNPGKYELVIPVGNEEVSGVVVARSAGEYEVRVMINLGRENTGRIEIRVVVERGAKVKIAGVMRVLAGAVKADGFVKIRVLMLDSVSSVIVEPQMEIKNNEVKAGHAVSISGVNEEEMWYLKSRGIGNDKARDVLVEGFVKSNTC